MATSPDLKIFIVDDDIFCITLYNQFLRNLGYVNVTSFTGGEECLNHMNASPDLVFLDYNMEGLNGVEVLKEIKSTNPATNVYIITGKEDPEIAKLAVENGAIDYIVKSSLSPDKMKSLMQSIEDITPERKKESQGSFLDRVKRLI